MEIIIFMTITVLIVVWCYNSRTAAKISRLVNTSFDYQIINQQMQTQEKRNDLAGQITDEFLKRAQTSNDKLKKLDEIWA